MPDTPEFSEVIESACRQLNVAWAKGIVEVRDFIREATMKLAREATSNEQKNDDARITDAEPKSAVDKLLDSLGMRFNRQVEVPAAEMIEEILSDAIKAADSRLVVHYANHIHHRAMHAFHRGSRFESIVNEGGDLEAFINSINESFPSEIAVDGLEFRKLDIVGMLEQMNRGFSFGYSKVRAPKGVDISLVLGPGAEARVLGHGDMMQEIFWELCKNAFEHMKEGGRLEIRTRREGDEMIIEFEDSGMGIAEEDIGRVFEDGFTKRKDGTGKGLYNAKLYIEEFMKGRIEVECLAGKGATFRITLPLARD